MHSRQPLLRRTRWAAVPATIAEYCWRTVYTASLSTVYSLLPAVGGHEMISLDCRKRGPVGDWLARPTGGIAARLLHARIAPPDTSTVHHCLGAMLLPCSSEIKRIVFLARELKSPLFASHSTASQHHQLSLCLSMLAASSYHTVKGLSRLSH